MFRCFLLFVTSFILVGCTGRPTEIYVIGQVTYKDKPVTVGRITFHDAKDKTYAAELEPTGRYNTRLPPGEYKVSIRETPSGAPLPNPMGEIQRAFPERYTDPARSKLTATIKPGEMVLDFALKD